MLEGKIIKNISNHYTVLSDNKLYICTPRGKFRKDKITPLVGDRCLFDNENNYILEILPRQNELDRPSVANIDIAVIVTSLKQPDYSSFLLDKEIVSITLAKITPVICFTKLDLLSEEEKNKFLEIRKYYQKIGIPVFVNTEIEELENYLNGKIVVLTGQTGAGKSTLINKIAPSLNLKTDEISKALNRGKHTTRHTEIFIEKGIWLCDTPGFSSLDIQNKTKEEIRDAFLEFQNYSCKFQDCMHINEVVCGVKDAVAQEEILLSRYENYQKMWKESSL